MILGDHEIKKYINDYQNLGMEKPLISPFREEKLQSVSYDISIGNKIKTIVLRGEIIELDNEQSVKKCFETRTLEEDGYILKPNETILFPIAEYICLPEKLLGHIRPRTTFSRLALSLSPQHINPTYEGRLELVLTNNSPNNVRVNRDMKIGQILFEEISGNLTPEKLYKNKRNAKYHKEDGESGSKVYEELTPNDKEIVDKLLGIK